MDAPDQLASDAEREATADRLRGASGEGRLSPEELDQRLDRAFSARTHGELTALTTDLPAAPTAAPKPPSFWQRTDIRAPLAGAVGTALVMTLIWAATGADGSFWPVWFWILVGIVVIRSVVQLVQGDDADRIPPTTRD